jgi:hypothetical protein
LEIAGIQPFAVRGADTLPAPPQGNICYINLEAAAWWNVEWANSKVFTVGVPSITLERVFKVTCRPNIFAPLLLCCSVQVIWKIPEELRRE